MGLLTLAGGLSGAGTALQQSLAKTQETMNAKDIENLRQEMENKRQDKNLEAQKQLQAAALGSAANLQAESLKAGATEGRLTRESNTANTVMGIGVQNEQFGKKLASDVKLAQNTIDANKQIHDESNKTQLQIAKLQRQMQEKQFDKTFTAAKLTALTHTVSELGNTITRLSVVVSNPLADKTDPNYQAAVLQLETATKMHNMYAKAVGANAGVDTSTIGKPAAAKGAVVMPDYGAGAAAPTPGVMNTPAGSYRSPDSVPGMQGLSNQYSQ